MTDPSVIYVVVIALVAGLAAQEAPEIAIVQVGCGIFDYQVAQFIVRSGRCTGTNFDVVDFGAAQIGIFGDRIKFDRIAAGSECENYRQA